MSAQTQLANIRAIIESEQRPIGDRAEALVAQMDIQYPQATKKPAKSPNPALA